MLPDAWISLYAYKLLVLSACLFGGKDTTKEYEAWKYFEDAISYFEEWFVIPSDALLVTGFGDIHLTKDRQFAVHPDGTREYIAFCMCAFGCVTPDYLLTDCLNERNR